jgi:hypothetical protein
MRQNQMPTRSFVQRSHRIPCLTSIASVICWPDLTFIRLVRTSFWLLDKGEGFAEVGREWVLGGEGAATYRSRHYHLYLLIHSQASS